MLQLATTAMLDLGLIRFKYVVVIRWNDGEICDMFETNSWTMACEFVKKQGPNLEGKSIKIEENY